MFTIAVCVLLAVVGLVVSGVVPAESLPMPAGVLDAFQLKPPGIAESDDRRENLSHEENGAAVVRASAREEESEHLKSTREEDNGELVSLGKKDGKPKALRRASRGVDAYASSARGDYDYAFSR